jgi:hypothetical protein
MKWNSFFLFALIVLMISGSSPGASDATVGLETMERPELLPFFFPAGTETRQFISYDTSGSNNDGNFETAFTKYIDSNGEYVIFDASGPGCLYRQQFNCWGRDGSAEAGNFHLKYYFDDEPLARLNVKVNKLFGGALAPFDSPFGFHDPKHRFSILYYPFSFQKRLKVTTTLDGRQHLKQGFSGLWYQYTYLTYPNDSGIQSWAGRSQDSQKVREQWNQLGTDPKNAAGNVSTTKTVSIPRGSKANLLELKGQGAIASLKLALAPFSRETYFDTTLRIYWDGNTVPAVDMPLGYFFGGGAKDYPYRDRVWNKSLKTLFFGFDK